MGCLADTTSSYYVCEKSDGLRYLLYLTKDENNLETPYLIDRRNDYWYLPPNSLHFPLDTDEQRFHTETLVDGELVMDDLGENKLAPKFLIFDCLVLGGKDLMQRTLDKRLGYFKETVFKPYRALFRKYPEEAQYQAFEVEMKDMQFSYGIEKMFREVLPSLKHGNDGLIFTCRMSPYQHGTDQHILKWKPVAENTIDFRLQLRFKMVEPDDDDDDDDIDGDDDDGDETGRHGPYPDFDGLPVAELFTFHGHGGREETYQLFGEMYLSEDEWAVLRSCDDPLSNRIVECGLDENQRWRLHRFRDDKDEANHISTVHSVLDSIRDSVSEQELKDAAQAIRNDWKARQATEPKR